MDTVMEYLRSMLGGEVTHSELSAEDTRKTGWAANLYVLGRASLRGVPCIIAIAKGTVRLAPAAVAKQVARLKEVFGCPVIHVPRAVGPHDVQRLAAAGGRSWCRGGACSCRTWESPSSPGPLPARS